MPTYVYQCHDCEEQTEVIQRFSDAPLTVCPKCGGELQRILFPPAIIFKGSGWYITDHGRSLPDNGSSRKEQAPAAAKSTLEDKGSPGDATSTSSDD
jgi:putative FmdB family regulatory protein